jgi:quinoprotein glucose dehydrogenase
MPAFDSLTDKEVSELVAYLLEREEMGRTLKENESENPEHDYRFLFYKRFKDHEGYPGSKPPWGWLNAIDLNSGEFKWRVPLGEYSELSRRGIPVTGTENFGGPTVTAGGLVFVGGTLDNKFRAFDKDSGEELWAYELPFGAYAPPATYFWEGRQYVVVVSTGANSNFGGLEAEYDRESGDAFYGFALPLTREVQE